MQPAYVFDGKPPELKKAELASRAAKKAEADADYEAALAGGDAEEIRKASHRTARATPQMNADVQELLRLLGCPVVLAPCEAEASCAALCRAGKVFAAATEDMDCLTFGSDVMLKNLFDTESSRTQSKRPVYEIRLSTLLEQLDVTREEFGDFCILCGCDYCGTIRGVGPATAFKLLKTHGSIEAVLASLDEAKRPNPEDWPVAEARRLFTAPDVVDAESTSLSWKAPDFEGLTAFLVQKHDFNEQRVAKYCKRLKALQTSGKQMRLDSFFKVGPSKAVPEGAKFNPFAKKGKGGSSSSSAAATGGKRASPAGGKQAATSGKKPKAAASSSSSFLQVVEPPPPPPRPSEPEAAPAPAPEPIEEQSSQLKEAAPVPPAPLALPPQPDPMPPAAAESAPPAAPAPPHASAALAEPVYRCALGQPDCPYGTRCYRRNLQHWAELNHPPDHPFIAH